MYKVNVYKADTHETVANISLSDPSYRAFDAAAAYVLGCFWYPVCVEIDRSSPTYWFLMSGGRIVGIVDVLRMEDKP